MTTPQPTDAPKPARGLNRSMTVLILLLGGAIALIGSTQTWVTATGFEAAHISHVQLSGQEASPIITAMSLVTIAAGAALSIARNLGRWIIGIVAILSAIAIGWASLSVWTSPATAVAPKIAETTGTTGMEDIADNIDVSLLPWLTVFGALLVLLGGIVTLIFGSRWPVGKTKKYERADQIAVDHDAQLDEIDTWDELSRGEDPT
ncbi:MAG TPA: Trp biosynthesis-associated membrane protein [Candidatus Yaniella excrementigallinarum]|nr:Trp biosynthesis-associated membrane protein [Candidatus Yaniella excrementigallinarum]